TQEVNAAIRGIRKSGQTIGVITVCDSHAAGENILIEELESGVNLIKGTPRKYYMMQGISKEYDVAFFVGYHPMAGTQHGGMEHTYSSISVYNVSINGQYVGETEINAALAGHYRVPLGLVTGDNMLLKEVRKFFDEQIEVVLTKHGISRFAAQCRHPKDVHEEIEMKAARVMKKIQELKIFRFKIPLSAEIDLSTTLIADMAELIPGVKRIDGRKLIFRAKDILEFYRILRLVCTLGLYANSLLT
ncbi:hypothetical protein AMJ83_11675, partial [candidate division WOR_3 bacterium SM23_42]